MKVYSLTSTLDEYVDFYIDDPKEAEVIVVGGKEIKLNDFPKLKCIFKCGVGTDNIPNLDGTGIELIMPSIETKLAITAEVANFTIGMILKGLYRNSGDFAKWKKTERKYSMSRDFLVIGDRGAIGSRVRNSLSTMFSEIKGYDVGDEDLEGKIKNANVITLHAPLTDTTKSMIRTEWLKEDVVLVNTARAGLVDEDELYGFLSKNPKATALFDVFWEEPYKGKLLGLDNFIATPHIASCSDGFTKGLFKDLKGALR